MGLFRRAANNNNSCYLCLMTHHLQKPEIDFHRLKEVIKTSTLDTCWTLQNLTLFRFLNPSKQKKYFSNKLKQKYKTRLLLRHHGWIWKHKNSPWNALWDHSVAKPIDLQNKYKTWDYSVRQPITTIRVISIWWHIIYRS